MTNELVLERNGLRFIVRAVKGSLSEREALIAVKAVEALLSGGSSLGNGNGDQNTKINANRMRYDGNRNGSNGGKEMISPWVLTWLAEANGYRENPYILLPVFAKQKLCSRS